MTEVDVLDTQWVKAIIRRFVIRLFPYLKRDYIQNCMHNSGMWVCLVGLNPKFQSICSKNVAAQAPNPPQSDEFFIMCHLIQNSSFCGGVGACAASFFEQRL